MELCTTEVNWPLIGCSGIRDAENLHVTDRPAEQPGRPSPSPLQIQESPQQLGSCFLLLVSYNPSVAVRAGPVLCPFVSLVVFVGMVFIDR